jgi:hypothetical protein
LVHASVGSNVSGFSGGAGGGEGGQPPNPIINIPAAESTASRKAIVGFRMFILPEQLHLRGW